MTEAVKKAKDLMAFAELLYARVSDSSDKYVANGLHLQQAEKQANASRNSAEQAEQVRLSAYIHPVKWL